MNIRVFAARDLPPQLLSAWSEIQRANPAHDSPYFRPEFIQAVARLQSRVEVAVFTRSSRPVAFFPYRRTPWNSAGPVGDWLSDFQSVIAPAGFKFDPLKMLQECGLSAWHFDHLLDPPSAMEPFVWRKSESPLIDLSRGYSAYSAELEHSHGMLVRPLQKRRRLAREVGPLRYEPHVSSGEVLSTLMRWKSRQYERTSHRDVFAMPWTRGLLEELLAARGEHFSPMLSVLYAGDQIAAITYSLRCRDVLHLWFPAYNRAWSHCSPGILLLLETLQTAESLGIRRIDLGKGPEPFKRDYMTGAKYVADGVVDSRPGMDLVWSAWRQSRQRFRSSPFYTPAKKLAGFVRNAQGHLLARLFA